MLYGLLNKTGRNAVRKGWKFFVLSLGVAFAFVSCDNEHCDDSMYCPMEISFYSQMDTSEKIAPPLLLMKGIGSDSIMNFSGKQQIYFPLNPNKETSQFVFLMEPYSENIKYVTVKTDTLRSEDEILSIKYYLNDEEIFIKNKIGKAYMFSNDTICLFQDGNFYKPLLDTLNITSDLCHHFLSSECGYLTTFSLKKLKFSQRGVGFILIKNNSVTNKYNDRHVNIYLENY